MTEETTGFGLIPDPMKINPVSGKPTFAAQRAKEDEVSLQRESEWTLMDEALTVNNSIYDVAVNVAIELGTTDEEGFDPDKLPGLYDNIPPEFHKELFNTGSENEAWAKRSRIEEYLNNADKLSASGYTGQMALLAAGLIDADALLIPVSGGTYLGTKLATGLAKAGVKQGRLRGAVTGAGAGIEAGAITGIAGAVGGTIGDAGEIPAMILGGMAFGTTIGTAVGKGPTSIYDQMHVAKKAHNGYLQAADRGFIPASTMMSEAGSVGAAKVRRVDTPTTLRDSTKTWFDRAADDTNAINAKEVLAGVQHSESTNVDNVIGRAAEKVQNWTDKSPLRGLYTDVAQLGVIGNKLSYDLLYHPGGLIDGSVPAAGYDAIYTQELSIPIQNYHTHAMNYMGKSQQGITNKVKNTFTRRAAYDSFNRAVKLELESRYHDGKGLEDSHQSVKDMADDMDDMHMRAIEVQQGRAGETSVHGSEDIQHKPGYYARRWNGEELAKYKEKDIISALTESYSKLLPAGAVVDPKIMNSIVKSIVTRAKAIDEGIDTNLIGLLRDGGKEFLRDTLKNNKLSDKQIQSVIDAFTGSAAERAKPGFLKSRIELDMRVQIPGTDKMLLDLLEPDMYRGLHLYTRKVAGTSAMARKGYQLGDKTAVIEAIKDEMVANGFKGDKTRASDMLETTFSYFGAGSIGSGVDPLLLSTMRLTRQSLLGSLGLTQLGELGNVITMVGVEATMKHMPSELKAIFTGKRTPIVEELHDAFIFMDKDHILYDDELALDITGKSTVLQSQFADSAYKAVALGDKISGHTSLFYKAMTFSQRLSMAGVNSKLHKLLSKGNLDAGTSRRLLDLGLDDVMVENLQNYINKGVITKDADGNIKMNFKQWKPDDIQDYKLAMHEFVGRVIQKNLPGEIPFWATKQFGRFMSQLRMFPIQAFQKQFLRNMRHADATTAKSLLYNLGVAALVYSTSQIIKGRGDDLTPEKIAKGAINYAPTTGWLPMAVDPLAEVMGMPQLRMNKYGPPGRATDGIIPVPPALPTINRMLHLPGAVLGSVNGIDRQEASSMSSLPIIGNMYGFSALFNYLKDN